MPRVVLDTNVIVSGLLFGGIPQAIVQAALSESFDLAISPSLLDELERVLKTKFPHRWEAIQDTLEALREIASSVTPSEEVTRISEDPADNRVLECAISAHADAIISGDKHLLVLKRFRGIPILSPTAFL